MADIKWIKVAADMFEDNKIEFIRSLPDGDAIIVTWLQMLLIAGQSNAGGYLMVTDGIPYTEQLLSNKLRRQPVFLQFALDTLTKLKMVNIEDGPFHITNWDKHQNVDGMEKIRLDTAKRVAKHREKKRLEISGGAPCQYCGGIATGFDHIIPTARGGLDVDDNKVPCCIDCNRKKNDHHLINFLNRELDMVDHALIRNNPKLSRYVTLCNVTNRYKVTQCNATELEVEKDKEIKRLYMDNVAMTATQHDKLFDLMGEETAYDYMERYNVWITTRPPAERKRRCAYASIRKWYTDDQKKKPTKPSAPETATVEIDAEREELLNRAYGAVST
ncbi:phage replisome organizer N-terminal domain-containing protein [Paenibacillus silvisoli]|uniref:phage replisome organizer N-terminal domain-containing protein n=1 Tax=Paenibacillus silvisoli TaxID=3110539 RepID=UPI00280632F3|nr:phage replisome organizer N-terminal domain-containing protein [Paenibacillus silvisoli]